MGHAWEEHFRNTLWGWELGCIMDEFRGYPNQQDGLNGIQPFNMFTSLVMLIVAVSSVIFWFN